MARRPGRGKRHTRGLVAASLIGCSAPAGVEDKATSNVVEPARQDPAAEVMRLLARDAVTHDRFARRTLYTWTTKDQIEELRTSRQLLTRDESPAHGASYLDQVLYTLAQRGDPTATLLYTTAFAKMRFAWHAPWATRAGWPREQYGDQLIRVTLRPAAVIVSVSTATGVFEARNLMNEPVPLATVRAKPELIGAIFFESITSVGPAAGLITPPSSFREYALCNESMIESWEVGTQRIAAEIAANAATVDAVVRYLEQKPGATGDRPPVVWNAPPDAPDPPTPERAYAAALALESQMYRLDAHVLGQLAGQLRATPMPVAFEGSGTQQFAPGVARKPPRIVRQLNTYATYSMPSPTAARP